MERTAGATNVTVLLAVVSFMGIDLMAIRLGLARSLRLIRAAWATVPPPSTLGLALGALSLLALAVTMWWHRLSAAPSRSTRRRTGGSLALRQ
jgi:hypothetical protein